MPSCGEPRSNGDCDGRWVAQVDAGRDPVTGRRRYLRRVRASERDAYRALTDLRREAGIPAAVEGITVGSWCAQWLEDCGQQVRIGELAPSTVTGYDTCVRVHILPNLGHVRLDQLSAGHVTRMMRAIQASGRAATTARWARATLSSALSAAVADALIEVNVARAARPPALPEPNPSYFSSAEMTAIAGQCDQHRLGAMFILSALTGMRASELRGLRWSDVDLADGSYQVTEGLHRVTSKQAATLGLDAGLVGAKPKSSGSARRTPLSPAAIDLLRSHRKAQAAERLAAASWADGDRVFTTGVGEALSSENVRRQWYRLLERAGVPAKTASGKGRGLHELRRTFATRLREQGVRLEEVQRLGRWASPQVLLRHYAAVDEAQLRASAGKAGDGVSW